MSCSMRSLKFSRLVIGLHQGLVSSVFYESILSEKDKFLFCILSQRFDNIMRTCETKILVVKIKIISIYI